MVVVPPTKPCQTAVTALFGEATICGADASPPMIASCAGGPQFTPSAEWLDWTVKLTPLNRSQMAVTELFAAATTRGKEASRVGADRLAGGLQLNPPSGEWLDWMIRSVPSNCCHTAVRVPSAVPTTCTLSACWLDSARPNGNDQPEGVTADAAIALPPANNASAATSVQIFFDRTMPRLFQRVPTRRP